MFFAHYEKQNPYVFFFLHSSFRPTWHKVSSSRICFILMMTHSLCNSDFTSKDEYQLAFAAGSLSFIVERLVGGRLVMINRVALFIL